jgi:hypothetical protein
VAPVFNKSQRNFIKTKIVVGTRDANIKGLGTGSLEKTAFKIISDDTTIDYDNAAI